MAQPRIKKTNQSQSPQLPLKGPTAQEVLSTTLEQMEAWVKLQRPDRSQYTVADILSVVLYAAKERTTIEEAASSLEQAPHPNTVRGALAGLEVKRLEEDLNAILSTCLPKGLLKHPAEVAVDFKLVPYYGQPKPGEEDFVLPGPAKEGTNRFFGYASLYLIKKNKRFTLAMTVVRKSDSKVAVLRRLLDRLLALGGQIRCLYLDREFYTVEVLRFLIEERNLPFCMAAPKKGKEGGINGLVRQGPGVYPHTVASTKAGKIEVTVIVVGRYFKGRWKKHGRQRYAFVIHRYPFALQGLFEKYRSRFGIETSHRIWEQARARTASQKAAIRCLLVGTAILLQNLWILVLWSSVSLPSQGGRRVLRRLLSFHRFLLFNAIAIQRIYHLVEEVRFDPHTSL